MTARPVGEQPRVDVVDARGQRVTAAVTALLLSAAFLTGSAALLGLQVAVFATAAILGVQRSPIGIAYAAARDRWFPDAPRTPEPADGPRFSQAVGGVVSGTGLALVLAGQPGVGWALVLVVIALSTLLAVTGLCVGCELHGLLRRLRRGGRK